MARTFSCSGCDEMCTVEKNGPIPHGCLSPCTHPDSHAIWSVYPDDCRQVNIIAARPCITVEIPIAYLSEVSIGANGGPSIFFDTDACPKTWDAASIGVDLKTAIRAAELLEKGRELRAMTRKEKQ